jgi:hypothetical protein
MNHPDPERVHDPRIKEDRTINGRADHIKVLADRISLLEKQIHKMHETIAELRKKIEEL